MGYKYIWNWLNLGVSEKMLEKVANHCFKCNVRTLDGMNTRLEEYLSLGILSEASFDEYCTENLNLDKKIKSILEKIGLSRNVNQFDRDKYKVWKEVWQMSDELIDYACTLSVGKDQPIQYLASILSSFHDKKISRVEEAKQAFDIVAPTKGKQKFSSQRTHTKEEARKLSVKIEEIEI